MKKQSDDTLAERLDKLQRNLGQMERSNRDILLHGSEDPQGYVVPYHSHSRTQFLCVFSGVVLVVTERGRWMIPPGHALLIPVGMLHSVEMLSDVSMKSVYVSPRSEQDGRLEPEVLEVTDLARSLLLKALRLQEEMATGRKSELVLTLLVEEISSLERRPLSLPFPADPRLSDLCGDYVANPSPNVRLDDWAEKMAMSRRSFTRFFRKQTGVSFITWRQQASVLACLPQLAGGTPVTLVALEAGYQNTAAFTTMFRRMLGHAPRNYMAQRRSFDRS